MTKFSFHWLLEDPDSQDAQSLPVPGSEPLMLFELGEESANASLRRLDLDALGAVFHGVHDMSRLEVGKMVPLAEVTYAGSEEAFSAQLWVKGASLHEEDYSARQKHRVFTLMKPGQTTFRRYSDFQANIYVEAGVRSEMCSLVMPLHALEETLGCAFSDDLIRSLGIGEDCRVSQQMIPASVSIALKHATHTGLSGRLKTLYAQGKVLEYLAMLAQHFSVSDAGEPSGKSSQKAHEIRAFLETSEGRVPSLSTLSAQFGLSPRSLNQLFKSEFGKTVYAYVASHRLHSAHAALTETDVAMKALAHNLGYSHVNHFITAFKREFGYTPGTLRRSKSNI